MIVTDLAEFLAWVQDNYIDCGDNSYIEADQDNEDTEEGSITSSCWSRQDIASKYITEVKGQG